jgi:hypothetical protein
MFMATGMTGRILAGVMMMACTVLSTVPFLLIIGWSHLDMAAPMSLRVTWQQFRALPPDIQAGLIVGGIGFGAAALALAFELLWIIWSGIGL